MPDMPTTALTCFAGLHPAKPSKRHGCADCDRIARQRRTHVARVRSSPADSLWALIPLPVLDRAACAGRVDLPWVPTTGHLTGRDLTQYVEDKKTMRRLCHDCPALQPCQEFALAHPRVDGMWGGLDLDQRQAIRAGRR